MEVSQLLLTETAQTPEQGHTWTAAAELTGVTPTAAATPAATHATHVNSMGTRHQCQVLYNTTARKKSQGQNTM